MLPWVALMMFVVHRVQRLQQVQAMALRLHA
jgi:hypothetical protein